MRQLRNAIERAVVLCPADIITPQYLPDALFHHASGPAVTFASLEAVERDHIMRVLAESPTLEDAAATLGINVSTLWRKRKRYELDRDTAG